MTPIRFLDVHRHFAGRSVLRGLSFAVAPGQVYALLGRNGTGKTTALRILLGFLRPHRGRAELLGLDSRALTPAARGRIGYVGEGHRLDPTLRIADVLAFEQGTRPGFRRALVDRVLQRCGLAPRQVTGFLSRGQRAQLALALAIATEPEVLVCDDPALGLDVVMRREFLDAMIDLLADTGVAVLFSSHILTDVERIADRIGILDGGVLQVDATLDDLKRRVVRRGFVARDGGGPPQGPPVLRAAARRGAHVLTLLDADPTWLANLAGRGDLGPAEALSLEDLFLDLTGPEHLGLFAESDAPRALAGVEEA